MTQLHTRRQRPLGQRHKVELVSEMWAAPCAQTVLNPSWKEGGYPLISTGVRGCKWVSNAQGDGEPIEEHLFHRSMPQSLSVEVMEQSESDAEALKAVAQARVDKWKSSEAPLR